MAKKRVSDIAKEAGLNPKEVVEKLQKEGLSVKAVASQVDENEAKRILGINGAAAPRRRVVIDDPVPPGRSTGNGPGRGGPRGRAGAPGRSGPGNGRSAGPQAGPPATPDAPKRSAPPRLVDPPRPPAPSGDNAAPPAPNGAPQGEAAQGDGGDASRQRPTRDSRQGERAPTTGGGGRRRVVIDSQAARRGPGGPGGPGGGPPPNQPRPRRRGRRRRYVEIEPAPLSEVNAVTQETIKVNAGSTVKDVSEYLGVSLPEVIKKLMMMGEMATQNQVLSDEAIALLAAEFDKEIEVVTAAEDVEEEVVFDDPEEDLVERPPVVTIMGHVDHGKTSLLDAIRSTEVAAGEAGGITQHIGAYQVHHGDKEVTFLDTPGHQAFTAMRARGAQVTDIAVIVIAADDGMKPQTEEAIDHAKAADVPMLVAVNKIDKEGAQPDRVRSELAAKGLQPVEWGGDTEFVNVSAKTKEGLDDLIETILVMAEVEELKANPKAEASGSVIESKLDPGRGATVTLLVERGTVRVQDAVVAGAHWGRIRAMHDFLGNKVTEATPGEPVEVLGFDTVPDAGEVFRQVENDRKARQIAGERAHRLKSEAVARRGSRRLSLEDIFSSGARELGLILKADVAGSLEAVQDEIARLPQAEVAVDVVRSAVGGITESDVDLAAAAGAVIIGFNVRPVGNARELAERQGVEIRSYSVIYRAIEDLHAALEGMLEPEEVEDTVGRVEIRATFRASRVGVIAGSYVLDGKVTRGAKVRLVRDGTIVYTGEIASLRRFNDDAREVTAGYECGIVLKDFMDVKEGDELEVFETRSVERELAPS